MKKSATIIIQRYIHKKSFYSTLQKSCNRKKRGSILSHNCDCMEAFDDNDDIPYVESFDEAFKLMVTHQISLEEALTQILVTLHKSRRKKHQVSLMYILHIMIHLLKKPKEVKKLCKVGYYKGEMNCPYIMIYCLKDHHLLDSDPDKYKKCPYDSVVIDQIIRIISKFQYQAIKQKCEYAIKYFQKIIDQLCSSQIDALRVLIPNRIAICPDPGNIGCCYSSGFILSEITVEIPECGHDKCSQCKKIKKSQTVKIATCPNSKCVMDDPDGIIIDSNIIKVPTQWCVECGGIHDENDKCDLHSAWKRVPEEEKKHINQLISENKARHCPKCYFVIIKGEGCSKMHCSNCDACFCMECGDYVGDNYLIDHLFMFGTGEKADDFVCRRTAIENALSGNPKYISEIIKAYPTSHIIKKDIDNMVLKMDPKTIPLRIVNVLTKDIWFEIIKKYNI